MTRPSISMAPSFFGMSSAVLTSVAPDGPQRLTRAPAEIAEPEPAAAPTPTEAQGGHAGVDAVRRSESLRPPAGRRQTGRPARHPAGGNPAPAVTATTLQPVSASAAGPDGAG